MTTSPASRRAEAPARPRRFFEDLEPGETTRSNPRVVTAEEIIDFASRYDPQYFHIDAQAAKDSLFGGLIGSGIHTAALWRMMDHEVNGEIAFVCGVAWDNVKWARAVRPGDALVATSRLVMKRPSSKRQDAGVVTIHHEVLNQDGAVVLAFDSTDLVYRRRP